jgi:hypothetical protein
MPDEIPQLRPARPDLDDARPGYLPKLPWKWIGGLGTFLVLSIGTCQIREKQEVAAMRANVLDVHRSQLGPLGSRYDALLAKIYRNTAAAASRKPETYVDPRLKLDALGSGQGIYLRLRARDAADPEKIASASLDVPKDAIGACLGLSPVWFAELYAHGTFLESRFIKQAETADSVMKLRVIAEELRQRTKRDLPFVANALKAQWFMLTLERGDNRRDAPVDVYVWDLRDDTLLLSARAQADGVLVSARIAVSGQKPGQYARGAQSGAAQDCSIASQLRAAAGATASATTFGSEPPAPKAAMDKGSPAPAAQKPAAASGSEPDGPKPALPVAPRP